MKKIDLSKLLLGSLVPLGLIAFELSNFETSRIGIELLIGDIAVFGIAGLEMATILAIAACSIDLGALASIFTEEKGFNEPWYVWALGGAWFVASFLDAWLTWYFLDTTMATRGLPATVADNVPIMLSFFMWLIRVMLIGNIVASHNKPARKPNTREALGIPVKDPMAALREKSQMPRIAVPQNGKVKN